MKLKIYFTDFWPDFNPTDNYFWSLLSEKFELELNDNPDMLFFSVFGNEHKKFNCFKIFFTGEHYKPSMFDAHLSISYCKESERNLRYPLYLLYYDLDLLLPKRPPEKIISDKQKFCCFIVSNKSCKARNKFFKKLSKYKQVDSGGKYLNNIGGPVEDKNVFIKDYKFIICFENISYPGYTTEKIVEAMKAECIPIYWGNPDIGQEFNTKSFINVHEYKNFEDAIERVIALDNDDLEYFNMLSQPWFERNFIPEKLKRDFLLERIVMTYQKYKNNEGLMKLPSPSLSDIIFDKIERKLRRERTFNK